MGVTLNEIKWEIKPTRLPRNLIYFNFFLKSKIYNYVRSHDYVLVDLVNEETLNSYAEYHQTVNKNLYEDEFAVALDRILMSLLCSERVRNELVEIGLQELRRLLTTTSLCQNGGSFKVNLDFEIESICHHFYYSSHDIGECRMHESSIQFLNKVEVATAGDQCCSICLEDLNSGKQELLSMPCGHVFHRGCIDKWLSASHNCPLCRFQMRSATP